MHHILLGASLFSMMTVMAFQGPMLDQGDDLHDAFLLVVNSASSNRTPEWNGHLCMASAVTKWKEEC